jgi:hypothetical protein
MHGSYSIWDTIWCSLCILPWLSLVWIALADRTPRKQEKQAPSNREIQPRDLNMTSERAGFIQAKLEKIERASR